MKARGGFGWLAGFGCGAVVVATILCAYPFTSMGFVDDWSYLRTSEVLAKTGHVVYHGWASPIVGWQFFAGALFMKLFGYSFTVGRMSTVAIAFATVWLFERTLEGFGLTRRNAVFGALTLGVSPLYIPLAASFMTDCFAVFALVVCCYLCQLALNSETDRSALGWLVVAGLSNAVLGTVRQTAWLPGLFIVPATAWLMRRRPGALKLGVGLGLIVTATVVGFLIWWGHADYAAVDPVLNPGEWRDHGIRAGLVHLVVLPICTLLGFAFILFPILSAGLVELKSLPRKWLAGIVVLGAVLIAVSRDAPGILLPWMWDTLIDVGLGPRAFFDPVWTYVNWLVAAVVSFAIVVGMVAFAVYVFRRPTPSEPVVVGGGAGIDWGSVKVFAVPYLLGYAALLVTRVLNLRLYDRYLLGVFPLVILLLLRAYQDRMRVRLPWISYAVMVGFAVFGVMGTHDWFANLRALDKANAELVSAGVPRFHISGPPEIDGMTQLDTLGYMDEPNMHHPVGLYQPNPHFRDLPLICQTWMMERASVIRPAYLVRNGLTPCAPLGPVKVEEYKTWLPPFRAYVHTIQILHPKP